MKTALLVCTIDKKSNSFLKFYESLTNTVDISLFDLIISENKEYSNFHHPTEINKCIELKNDITITCDDDIIFPNGWFYNLMELFNNDTNNEILIAGFVNKVDSRYKKNNIKIKEAVPAWCLYSPCMAIRNMNIYMSTEYNKYYFDVDFCLQAWDKGFKVMCLPDVIVHENEGSMKTLLTPVEINKIREEDKKIFETKWNTDDRKKILYKNITEKYNNIVKEQPKI